MKHKMKYTCSNCGEVHEGWPALAYDSPDTYADLPQTMKEEIGQLDKDFCVIQHPEQTDRFIRGTLTIKVIDHCEDLDYGVWVSLSENSFQDYSENFDKPDHEAGYFGWLSNNILRDETVTSIPTSVYTRQNGQRPEIVPHEDFDHQLVRDYYEGITKAEAERRIHEMLEAVDERNGKTKPSKRWWKLW